MALVVGQFASLPATSVHDSVVVPLAGLHVAVSVAWVLISGVRLGAAAIVQLRD